MKSVVSVVAVLMLTSCAGAFVEQTPIVAADGKKYYLITSPMTSSERSRNASVRDLTDRANVICRDGYDLMNEEAQPVNNPAGFHNGAYKLLWQIKCKNQS